NDAQVLAPADLYSRLNEPATPLRDKRERLDDHSFPAALCELLPLRRRLFLARRVGQVNAPVRGSDADPTVRGRPIGQRLAATVPRNYALAAAATAAYCCRMSSCAFADHGISSQSRQTQSVLSFSQNPVWSKAPRTTSSNSRSTAGSSKKRRPVRV